MGSFGTGDGPRSSDDAIATKNLCPESHHSSSKMTALILSAKNIFCDNYSRFDQFHKLKLILLKYLIK